LSQAKGCTQFCILSFADKSEPLMSKQSLDRLDIQAGVITLEAEKDKARMLLLDLAPEEAQKQAEATIYPQLWQPELTVWEESIPTTYGETDPR
jgi:hypothetical protein